MRIFLIIDETYFFHPQFVYNFLSKNLYNVVGAAIVSDIPDKNNLKYYLIRNLKFLKFAEILKLSSIFVFSMIKDILPQKKGSIYSVKSALNYFNINYFEVRKNINQKDYINKIKLCRPDVICSSNSLFLGEEILSIPKKSCLNRHSSLLPSYKGLWPVFHAYINNETSVGVSVHTMNNQIDSGIILSSKELKIEKNDSIYNLYKKCFDESVEVLIQALQKVEENDYSDCRISNKDSYFSWPSSDDWIKFRKMKGRFI